jgi:hypothetical protein
MQIAATIRELPAEMSRHVVAERFADMLAADNPRFNREKFMAAAVWGIQERRRSLTAVARTHRSTDAASRLRCH